MDCAKLDCAYGVSASYLALTAGQSPNTAGSVFSHGMLMNVCFCSFGKLQECIYWSSVYFENVYSVQISNVPYFLRL